ncbi:hypothetical protein AGMMS49574_24920 [Bacteroidia bacterium]|nr:hypothetical protein AGMMS49574_24920 [Bacteroidia bacterium]
MIDSFFKGRQQLQESFDAHVDSINTEFAKYLAKSWELFKVEAPLKLPPKPEPKVAPVYVPNTEPPTETPVNAEPAQEDTTSSVAIEPKHDRQAAAPAETDGAPGLNFFGTPLVLDYAKGKGARLAGTDERQVADYWLQLSRTNYSPFIAGLNAKKASLGVGAWGVYRLIYEWADANFLRQDENEKTVFIVYMLNQAGYKAKIGRAKDALLVMMAFRNTIYGKEYIRSGNECYYIMYGKMLPGVPVASYKLNYGPATSFIDLRMRTPPKLGASVQAIRRTYGKGTYIFQCNNNLVDYYNTFPQTDLEVYAGTPLSTVAIESMNAALAAGLKDKSAGEKLKFLLSFVQDGFGYKTDEEQFGYEKFFFPEESLFYPYSDCEDRAILFCRMVKMFCGLDTLLVEYPTHVAAAVKSAEPGDAIIYRNERYIICDPTYIGAPVGKTMTGFNNATAKIIAL